MGTLLVLIYIAFVSLGIPDSLLGATWPSMYGELGVDVAFAGILSTAVACGTVVSSLKSAGWVARFGTGKVTVVSILATAIGLLGFGLSHSFWFLLLFSIPMGIGGGAVDSALNNFVALHYEAKHMNWLHSFWGVGATISPVLVGMIMTLTASWRNGYLGMAALQGVLTAILLLSLPLWKRAAKAEKQAAKAKTKVLSLTEILKEPMAKPSFGSFLAYCGAEASVGLWGASYLVGVRGIAAETAATWVSAFYGGITLGRFAAGWLTRRWNNAEMIRAGEIFALAGIVALFIPNVTWLLPVAFFLIGAGFAPIYPALMHQTPRTFGDALSQSMMGVEVASAYVGSFVLPPLFGVLSGGLGMGFFPFYLLLLMLPVIACTEYVTRGTKGHPAK